MTDFPGTSCGCLHPDEGHAPASIENAPGLGALSYRIGTHGSFTGAMKLALARPSPLRALTTREQDDPTIALIDAWAAVLDVLTFYQERIANEGYLRTARERRSILELARAIGYELRPGVAASAPIAFLLDNTDASPTRATIPVGTKVQSIPKQGEESQIFETVEEIEARRAWNALRPLRRDVRPPTRQEMTLYFRGTATKLQAGDGMLIVNAQKVSDSQSTLWDFRRVQSIEEFPDAKNREREYTAVTIDAPLQRVVPPGVGQEPLRVYAFRQRARLFGYNAPRWDTLPVALRVGERDSDDEPHEGAFAGRHVTWVNVKFPAINHIDLDAVYPRIVGANDVVKGRWVVLTNSATTQAFRITQVSETGQEDYLLTGVTTRLHIEGKGIEDFSPRNALVFAESDELELAPVPITEAVSGHTLVLEGKIEEIPSGRLIALTVIDAKEGDPADVAVLDRMAAVNTPVPPLASPEGSGRPNLTSEWRTTLTLENDIDHAFAPQTLVINANVSRATHGETRADEVLGSGDASRPFQSFVLKGKPVTFTSARTASGMKSTIEIRVNDLLWDETRSFFGCGPTDHVYRLRTEDDGTVIVSFGDGIHGARPRSGIENVQARRYRIGTGLAGRVDAGQLSLVLNRPLGVKEARNPLAATGGDDREATDAARQNAPLTVLTLDRIVSVQDFEDFARAFAGIGKAQATLLWNGEQRVLHLTVAGAKGAAIPEGSDIAINLRDAIDAARHPAQAVRIDSYRLDEPGDAALTFDVTARLFVDPRAIEDDVLEEAKQALRDAFSFERREFGQPVASSDIIAVLQRTRHVVAVDLDALHFTPEAGDLTTATVEARLPSQRARVTDGVVQPAELLTINPDGIHLTVARK